MAQEQSSGTGFTSDERPRFDSPLLGKVGVATAEEVATLEKLAQECPTYVFAAINRELNRRGFMLSIEPNASAAGRAN